MAYTIDMKASAKRLLAAAQALHGQHDAVAGYLFGLAAECAIKAMAATLPELRNHDVLYAHFPGLRALVREQLKGRGRASTLLRLVQDDSFMNDWDITVRYALATEVVAKVDRWADQAKRIVPLMEAV